MKFGVLVFPGSNCDHDTYNAIAEVAHQPVTFLWHDSEDLQGVDAVLVPGGFAYGDYLRTGAIARFSPVMQAVKRFAAGGGLVLGICNGFQILTEAGLLPGALMRNAGLKYICKQVHLRVETNEEPLHQPTEPRARYCRFPSGIWRGITFARRMNWPGWRARTGSPSAMRPAGEIPPGGEPQWVAEQYCGDSERGKKCAGHDAPSRSLQRTDSRVGGRLEDFCLDD